VAESEATQSTPNPIFAGLKPEVVSERRAARQARAIAAAAGALPLIAAGAVTWVTATPPPATLEPQGQSPVDTESTEDVAEAVSTSGATTHTVEQGDSLQSIAATHGIPTAALLALNGLSWQTSVHAGQVLVVSKRQAPALAEVEAPAALAESPVLASGVRADDSDDAVITQLTDEMTVNARIIIQVGREMRIPNYGIVIALATAAQESRLRNLDHGDRDSVGLFQQRPSSGWGSPQQIREPRYAARAFFGGPASPTPGNTRGLLDIDGWQNLSVAEAAQAVQRSAFPSAYARWEVSAWNWLFDLT
jgi:LysM repeat protein